MNKHTPKNIPKLALTVVLTALAVAYPFLVLWALHHGHLLWVSLGLVVVALLRYALKPNTLFAPLTVLALVCGGASAVLQDGRWLKFYPVLMSVGSLMVFAFTLKFPPSMIERFARLHEPNLPESGVRWTYKVTQVWCGFFAVNALIALATVWADTKVWAVYNGFISYMLMGGLLLGEWGLRRRMQKQDSHTP